MQVLIQTLRTVRSSHYQRRLSTSTLCVHPAVRDAVRSGRPVVALESTIISHGMPYPQNVETALHVEQIITEAGAQPATVAVLNGQLCVGLTVEQLEVLGRAGTKARKVSRRDLASCLASGVIGATTVSGTMLGAHAAGISVFVTGGIGGVHRGVESTMDISADLTELGRTPVAVVSAGVKSILDIRKTLEYLETQGVPVLSLRPVDSAPAASVDFPAFFSPHSGVESPESVGSVDEAARVWAASLRFGLTNGMLLAVPNPSPAEGAIVQSAVDTALREANARGVNGREVTPFLLGRVAQLTGGMSLTANIALVKNNARVGAAFAVCLSKHMKRSFSSSAGHGGSRHANGVMNTGRPLVLGGSVMDVLCRPSLGAPLQVGTSNPGRVTLSPGGVGRNIADILSRLGAKPLFITHLGTDSSGQALAAPLLSAGTTILCPSLPHTSTNTTPMYVAMLDGRAELVAAVADMAAFEIELTATRINSLVIWPAIGHGGTVPKDITSAIASACIAVMDANPSADALALFARKCATSGVPLVFEPISAMKCVKAVQPLSTDEAVKVEQCGFLHLVTAIKPNAVEVEAMATAWRMRMGLPPLPASAALVSSETQEDVSQAAQVAQDVARTTAGKEGPPPPAQHVQSVRMIFGDPGTTSSGDPVEEAGGDDFQLDLRTLAAAQTVLAALIRPSGTVGPLGPEALQFAWATSRGVALESAPGGADILADIVSSAGPGIFSTFPGMSAPHVVPGRGGFGKGAGSRLDQWADTAWPGGLLDGRKHVWVSLGSRGLLWLSARCRPTFEEAMRASDLCASLPFFIAAQHPAVNFDFALIPPPSKVAVQKVTGAGDALVACTVWSLSKGDSMPSALRNGLAGAVMALEADPQDGAVPMKLTGPLVLAAVRDAKVAHFEHEYS